MILQWEIHIIVHLSKFIKCTTYTVTPNVNGDLWIIMLGQFRPIDSNKCTTLVETLTGREAVGR